MAPISELQFRMGIFAGFRRQGFSVSNSMEISEWLIEKILKASGPHWVTYNEYGTGQVRTSKYRTLKALLNALENDPNFKVTRTQILALKQRLKYANAIVEINKWIERKDPVEIQDTGLTWDQLFPNPISNAKKALEERIKQYWDTLKKNVVSTGSELKAKLLAMTPLEQLKLGFDMILMAGALVAGAENECVVGFLPLGSMGTDHPTSIQNIEVAHSNKVVKFRAIGSIFLAHQQAGGSDAIKISGKLTGPGRYIWLTCLWILSLLTQRYMQMFDWDSPIVTNLGSTKLDVEVFRETAGPLMSVQKMDDVVVQAPAFEKHITFPVVLTHEIIPNCYIETFSFSETLKGKKDTIEYDLLLRTYTEPTEFLANAEKTYYGLKKETKVQEVINYAINFTYRLFRMGQETWFIDNKNWKIKNYYDVDAVDVGMTFMLALGGLVI